MRAANRQSKENPPGEWWKELQHHRSCSVRLIGYQEACICQHTSSEQRQVVLSRGSYATCAQSLQAVMQAVKAISQTE